MSQPPTPPPDDQPHHQPQRPPQPPQPPYGGWGGQSALPAFPPAGGWASSNTDMMRPVQRRPLPAALFSLASWTALTFLGAFALGALFFSFIDALAEGLNDSTESNGNTLSEGQIAGYAAIFGAAAFGLHYLVGAVLLLLFRLGETFASWSTTVQGVLVWAVSAPVALIVLFVGGSAVA